MVADTGSSDWNIVQDRNHVSTCPHEYQLPSKLLQWAWQKTFSHTALEARTEPVSRKERDELRLPTIFRMMSIVVAQALEASDTPNWIVFRSLEAIDIVEV